MVYKFPEVDFSWLGNLPKVAQEADIQRARKETLANLPENGSADALIAGGMKLLRAGDFEGGQKLLAEGRQRKGVDIRGAAEDYYKQMAPLILKGLQGGVGGSPGGPGGGPLITAQPPSPDTAAPPSPFPPSPYGPRSAAPSPDQVALNQSPTPPPLPPGGPPPYSPGGVPSIVGPQGIPPAKGLPGLPPGLPGQRIGDTPSPSEAMLAQAEDPRLAGPAPGPQLAGPPPAPGPQAGPPPGLQPGSGALPPEGGQLPPGAPATPPAWMQNLPPRGPTAPGAAPVIQQQVQRIQQMPEGNPRLQAVFNLMAIGGKHMSPAQLAALREISQAELAKGKWSESTLNWQMDNFDRLARGERTLGKTEYDALQKTVEGTHKAARDENQKTADEASKAGNLRLVTEQISQIQQHPDFLSGLAAPLYTTGVNLLSSIIDIGKSIGHGFPVNADAQKIMADIEKKYLEPAQRSAALADTLSSLNSQAVFAKVGSLGANFSEGDRSFTTAIFPTLRTSKWGGPVINELLKDAATYQEQIGRVSDQYMLEKGSLASAPELRKYVDKWKEENPLYRTKDGKLTEAGARIQTMIDNKGVIPSQGSPTQAAPEAPKAPPQVISPDMEGKPYYDHSLKPGDPGYGKPAGVIRGGRPVPLGGI